MVTFQEKNESARYHAKRESLAAERVHSRADLECGRTQQEQATAQSAAEREHILHKAQEQKNNCVVS